MRALSRDGDQVLFVGGCVRNALLGQPVSDIDIATSLLPQVVMQRASDAGLGAVPTGIDHGTVTVVAGGLQHEVTTFRKDIDTDGRHATVAFGTDLGADAARRDFTMNALYASADGAVLDPLGGLDDLLARRVRFIGDPDARIREDRLRVLRFFRFFAQYGQDTAPDSKGLVACQRARGDLGDLSRERVGAEMTKLLAVTDPTPAVEAMIDTGVLPALLDGVSASGSIQRLSGLIRAEATANLHGDWLRRLWALAPETDPTDALRLSRRDARRLSVLRRGLSSNQSSPEAAYRHGVQAGIDLGLARAALDIEPIAPDDPAHLARAADAICPVSAADLMPGLQGKALGERLAQLETLWIDSGFALTRDQLLLA